MTDKRIQKDHIARLSTASIDHAMNAIFWLDSAGDFLHVNKTATKKFGYTYDEFLSLNIKDLDESGSDNHWEVMWSTIKGLGVITVETCYKNKRGGLLPVEVTSNKMEFEGRTIACAFVKDVSERKKAERAARESEQRFRDIFNAVNDAIYILDPGTQQIIDTNYVALDLLGYSEHEIRGMQIEVIHPNEMKQLARVLKKVLSGEAVISDEFTCLRKDKKSVPADISFSLVKLRGKVQVLAMVRDITKRKKAERDLHNALEEVKSLKDRLEAENIYLQEEIKGAHNFQEIISRSGTLNKVLRKVEQVASTDATVLILGETGTGKELFARAVHNLSMRRDRPLVKINCAALPANLIESELFGHEKGAFTGALSRKIGRFELADKGTIFLDEIGDLPLELQSKLLRVLQEGEFERIGNPKTTKIDVRIIAATNRDIEQAVENRTFREGLFYRLNVFPIVVPPLRDRKDDIAVLANHFVKKFNTKSAKQITLIPQKVINTLQLYDWPGNVRELENIIERAVIISSGSQLVLGDWLAKKQVALQSSKAMPLNEVERDHIVEILESTKWRIREKNGAAEKLGLKPTTLESRMKKLEIERA